MYSIVSQLSLNKSRKSFVDKFLGDGKVRFSGDKGPPEKAGEAKVRVRVRALTVMDLALMSQPGFPVVK